MVPIMGFGQSKFHLEKFKEEILKKFGPESDSIENEEANEWPPPELLDQHLPLSKSPDIGFHRVFASIFEVNSKNKKVPISVFIPTTVH